VYDFSLLYTFRRSQQDDRMPLQNRVTPFSTIEAVDSRALVMGNRGGLHGNRRELRTQRWRTRSWIICRLTWRGARRQLMTPGSWTELFFLDEAEALAAGHRPCGYCRRDDYRKFLACLASATGWNLARPPRQPDIDAKLHADRVDPPWASTQSWRQARSPAGRLLCSRANRLARIEIHRAIRASKRVS
jgi:hypothetical protein